LHEIRIIPLQTETLVTRNTDLGKLLVKSMKNQAIQLQHDDIIVITHKIVSKAEGRVVNKRDIAVSERAHNIAEREGFDAHQVELALRESKKIIREKRALITLNKNGQISNFAGVDHSNAPRNSYVLLPANPDESALRLRQRVGELTGEEPAIIITDTEGRPWRKGAINLAIGCAGINAFKYNKNRPDLYGEVLKRSTVCQVDQLASAAELVMGQADESVPVAIIRGYPYEKGEEQVSDIYRSAENDLFR
jgi:coenzyme F420-0:L-glutamate ligase/coenzyme F420-1:gamma-L-glutamate ligase